MKYYIIAGEASGDLHAGNLIRELKKRDKAAHIRAWGGDLMEQQGAHLVKHYRDLAFMGFWEVIRNLGTIFKNLSFCKKDIQEYNPDVLVLVDYPGFNLRIAKWARKHGYRVIYYISPQVWAWKENRVFEMKRTIDQMLVILPFEKNYYQEKWDWEVEYVGHPLVPVINKFLEENPPSGEKNIIALLPGSRKQEILKKLPVMLELSRKFPAYKFMVAKAPAIDDDFYHSMMKEYPQVGSVTNQTYKLLSESRAALVTSGTATLETALFGVPQVVCYRGSAFSYQVAKRVIRVKYIALVNLIMNREVVKELIQDQLTVSNLETELKKILEDPRHMEKLNSDYQELKNMLADKGNASARAAESILFFLN